MGITLYTIGHSNHDLPVLVDWLRAHGIQQLIDIRRHPGSRRLPQFNQGNLRRGLQEARLQYGWHGEALGGMRDVSSVHGGFDALASNGLRGFAQYMNTDAFQQGLRECLLLAEQTPTAIMCAERDPNHCHRQLISDYLVLRGHAVLHITGHDHQSAHEPNPAARFEDGMIYYNRGMQTELGLCW